MEKIILSFWQNKRDAEMVIATYLEHSNEADVHVRRMVPHVNIWMETGCIPKMPYQPRCRCAIYKYKHNTSKNTNTNTNTITVV